MENNNLSPFGPYVEEVPCDRARELCDEFGGTQLPFLPVVIHRNGIWTYKGTPLKDKTLVYFIASSLSRDKNGRYWINTPTLRGIIEVEDCPFLVKQMVWKGYDSRSQVISLRLNSDQILTIGDDHPLCIDRSDRQCGCIPIPMVRVRCGVNQHDIMGRLSRSVYYEMMALEVRGYYRGEPCWGVWSRNRFFPLRAILPD